MFNNFSSIPQYICEWNKLNEYIRTSNFDCFVKSVKTMIFTQQYGCTQFSPLKSHISVHYINKDYITTRRIVILYQTSSSHTFISDPRALHASLQCLRTHPVRKQIAVRAIRRIKLLIRGVLGNLGGLCVMGLIHF